MLKRIVRYERTQLQTLAPPLWDRTTDMAGVNINAGRSWDFLNSAVRPHCNDFDNLKFELVNGSFMAVDAHVYYGVIREYRPRKIIEVGAGYSTRLSVLASRRTQSSVTAIDPTPSIVALQSSAKIIASKVEDLPLDMFTALNNGDILFIDSSHCLTTGGDIAFLYCEVLPRLKPGVLIHVHDIYLPDPYPAVYHKQRLYYNEQYVLQAMLDHSDRYEVLWPGAWMYAKFPKELTGIFPEITEMRKPYPLAVPSSFWMGVK